MPDFKIKRLPTTSRRTRGFRWWDLIRFVQIDQVIDPRFPIAGTGGIASSSLIKAYIGLLCTGKSDFDAIESMRQDAFFRDVLGLTAVPSSPTLRQRMDTLTSAGIALAHGPVKPTNAFCAAPNRP